MLNWGGGLHSSCIILSKTWTTDVSSSATSSEPTENHVHIKSESVLVPTRDWGFDLRSCCLLPHLSKWEIRAKVVKYSYCPLNNIYVKVHWRGKRIILVYLCWLTCVFIFVCARVNYQPGNGILWFQLLNLMTRSSLSLGNCNGLFFLFFYYLLDHTMDWFIKKQLNYYHEISALFTFSCHLLIHNQQWK